MPATSLLLGTILAVANLGLAAGLAVVLVSFGILSWSRNDTYWSKWIGLEIGAGALCGLLCTWEVAAHPAAEGADGLQRVEADVLESRCGAQACASLLELRALGPLSGEPGSSSDAAGRVRAYGPDALVPGERVRALMTVRPHKTYRNPGLPSGGLAVPPATGWITTVRVLELAPARRWLESLRARVRSALSAHTAPAAAAVARALVLGESMALSQGERALIRGAGLAHLVAVSGLHMALLAGLWQRAGTWLFRRTPLCASWVAGRMGAAVGLLALPATVVFAGAGPSALRAGLTAAVTWLLVLIGRRPSGVAVGCVTGLACVAADPELAVRPGFLLSVAATASLLSAGSADAEPAASLGRRLPELRASVRTFLATLPIGLSAFGTASPWALLSNLVAVPFATLLWVPLALLHALTVSLWPLAAPVTAAGFESACELLLWACAALPTLPGATGMPCSPWSFGCFAVATCLALWGGPRRGRLVVVGVVSVLGCVPLALPRGPSPGELQVTFLDVGQGDAAVVRADDGRVALVDVGGRLFGDGPDAGQRAVVPYLRAEGVERVDLVILSHPHPDHIEGLPAVLEAFPVREIWDTGQADDEHPDGALSRWLREAEAHGTRVRRAGELCREPRQPWGAAVWRILAPCPAHDPGFGPNDNSFVVELQHGERRFLFPGDAEREQESRLLRAGSLRSVDVLKVGHHGSRTSSHADFLAAVSPRVAVISCGRDNPFGHPHADALSRLEARVPHVLRVDQLGGVRIVSDGRALRVSAHDPDFSLVLPAKPAKPAESLRRPDAPSRGPRPRPR